MIRRIFCLLGILTASWLSLFSATTTVSNLKFEIDEINGIAICSGPSSTSVSFDNLLIPNEVSYNDIVYPVVSISSRAFRSSKKITGTLTIGDNIECIDSYSFQSCTGITSIQLGKNIRVVGDYAFDGCTGLKDQNLKLGDKLQIIGNYAFRNCSLSGSLLLPSTINYINSYAFANNAFEGDLVLPTNLIEIGGHAFEANLFEKVIFNNNLKRIGEDVFNHRYLPNLLIEGDLILPNSIIEIGKRAFAYQSQFSNIKLGNNVEIIGVSAFERCSSLKEVFIPNSVKVIYAYAFRSCSNLETLIIGASLEKFGGEKRVAFNSGSTPAGLEIGNTFRGCPLTTVKCLSPTPPESIVYTDGNYSNFGDSYHFATLLYVPQFAIGSYRTADDWNRFDNILPLNEEDLKLGEIGGDMFSDGYDDEEDFNASVKERLYLQQNQELDLTKYITSDEINEWTCSNDEIVNLDAEKGTISAQSYGEAKVRGKDAEGNVVAVFEIFVCPTVSIQYGEGKSYQHHVIYNSTPSLYIAAPEGYEIAGVSHDGVDVTETVKTNEGYYTPTSPITDNTVISVNLKSTKNPADLNGDGKVDTSDLNWLLEHMMNF